MAEILKAISDGMKDSLRLASWIVIALVEAVGDFVSHRDGRHKHS
jgi:hypothetical protein